MINPRRFFRKIRKFVKYHLIDKIVLLLAVFLFIYGFFLFSDLVLANFSSVQNFSVKESSQKDQSLDLPEGISIPKIGLETDIQNPDPKDDLNKSLNNGIVRYPFSGFIDKGTILLLGHSSELKSVSNPNYKIFNGLKKLEKGDEIVLFSKDGEKFFYRIESVRFVLSDEESINFQTLNNKLILSTCNVLGKKEERIVVEAIKIS